MLQLLFLAQALHANTLQAEWKLDRPAETSFMMLKLNDLMSCFARAS
jgi:hypothetical protein